MIHRGRPLLATALLGAAAAPAAALAPGAAGATSGPPALLERVDFAPACDTYRRSGRDARGCRWEQVTVICRDFEGVVISVRKNPPVVTCPRPWWERRDRRRP
jgi:hypothetical protein